MARLGRWWARAPVPAAVGTAALATAAVVTSALVTSALVIAVPAAADPTVPRPGECYDLDDAALRDGGWWPDVPPVPCTEGHTFEVTETGAVPADVNAFDVAAERCSALAVWTAAGVNRSVAGIVVNPLRIEPRSFAFRGAPTSWVCGAVAVDYNGRAESTAVRLTASVQELGPRARALRHCASAADGRRAGAPPVTVPCSTRPRWQAQSWIVWSAFYDADPGRSVLRSRAADLCGPGTVATLPTAADWQGGLPLTWCQRKYP